MSDWPLLASPPARRRDRSGVIPTMALAGVMFGWMFLLLVASALTPDANLLPVGCPLEVGAGVTVLPAAGWSWGGESGVDESAGVEAIGIQKAGVRAFFIVEPFEGPTQEFHRLSLDDLAQDLDMFEAMPPVEVPMGADQAGLRSAFRGWTRDNLLEGVLASLSYGGSGISCLAFGRSGEVSAVLQDLELMLQTLGLPR